MENIDIINRIKTVENIEGNLREKFDLSLNPFPKSGIANIIDSEEVTGILVPAYEETTLKIIEYMQDALSMSGVMRDDKYLSLIIRGDYGTGKTQTLMYIKYLFGKLRNNKFRPYVIYIDNPGVRLSELIGNILSQIGIENFRRYLWDMFINYLEEKESIDAEENRKTIFLREIKAINRERTPGLFDEQMQQEDLTWDKVSISYKYLLDSFLNGIKSTKQRTVISLFKNYLLKCFVSKYELSTIAEYFYDIVTDNISVSKSWDQLITGNVKNIDKREFHLLHAIVEIAKKYLDATDFIILVDEFEEIAVGRLKDADVDNYLRNLRTLIDKDKNWCSVFAMNGAAYKRIESLSPPLASRIGDRKIDLKPLTKDALARIIVNYIALARIEGSTYTPLYPFSDESLNALLNVKDMALQGSPRFILKTCYLLLQRAAENLEKGQWITEQFVRDNVKEQIKAS